MDQLAALRKQGARRGYSKFRVPRRTRAPAGLERYGKLENRKWRAASAEGKPQNQGSMSNAGHLPKLGPKCGERKNSKPALVKTASVRHLAEMRLLCRRRIEIPSLRIRQYSNLMCSVHSAI